MVAPSLNRGEVVGPEVPERYRELVRPHVESFDYFLGEGMNKATEAIEPVRIFLKSRDEVWRVWLENVVVDKPVKEDGTRASVLLPRECRETGGTYRGPLAMDLCVKREGSMEDPIVITKRFGLLPIMVGSKHCHLRNKSRRELVLAKEEANEFGGIFICNGIERIIRMLIQQRRHVIMALRRSAYKKRGSKYTEHATLFRCVSPDESSATVRLHYLRDGNVNFCFTIRRAEYFIPVAVLFKAFVEVSDKELFDRIVAGAPLASGQEGGHTAFVADRVELALRTGAKMGCASRAEVLTFLGKHFRVAMPNVADSDSDIDVGLRLLERHVFLHLRRDADKFALLAEMLHKLYALVNMQCCEDNPDALTNQEILLPGQLLLKYFKEKMEECIEEFAKSVTRELDRNPVSVSYDEPFVRKVAERLPDIGRRFEYLLNTGNIQTQSGLDLSQSTGFTVVAEKLNFFRYMSHFRSVHRGAYFMEIRTTTVRKLLPESWGFMCPVHTPDGSPCGLLMHFTHNCNVVAHDVPDRAAADAAITALLVSLGMLPLSASASTPRLPEFLPVHLDGRIVGHVRAAAARGVVKRLRAIKARNLAAETGSDVGAASPLEERVPYHMEVCLLPYERGGPYPGLLLFTQPARMVRPVRQADTKRLELVGTMEQFNMNIRCPDGGAGGSPGLLFTHEELDTSSMLSEVANLTPFSDFNQSPRNMYQCQMGKQTMGTPSHTYSHRTDTKLYRLNTPQKPLARTRKYDELCMDDNAQGTNMVVAVAAYTGYDMEDAMILNKSAVDRGLAHGTLYKTEIIDLKAESRGANVVFAPEAQSAAKHEAEVKRHRDAPPVGAFGDRFPQNIRTVSSTRLAPDQCHADSDRIDADGLPHIGAVVWPAQAFCNSVDLDKQRSRPHRLKGEEQAVVQQVTVIGQAGGGRRREPVTRANVTLRLNRNPVIGDKFASRAGQKGVLGAQWPDVDMPYCAATGMRPDLLINPHAFPSRMTIGMLLESMASKAGALRGEYVDASPFQKCDAPDSDAARDPVAHFGAQLEARGFARHGQETMVCGYTGKEMPCDIFIGLVYYQRLRHMVKDKFQVRSTGKNNPLTKQPIKGRKVGGGIRFGEMERDSLLAHGAAYLLHDRLHYCSDYSVADVCARCGSMLSPLQKPSTAERLLGTGRAVSMAKAAAGAAACTNAECGGGAEHIERVAVPYVFRYLVCELAAMNIKVSLSVK